MTVTVDIQQKIKKRRREIDPASYTDHHIKARHFLELVDEVALWMSGAIISVLSETLDDLKTSETDFRVNFQRCCRRVLTTTAQREERVIFFHEAIPGFTVLVVKKEQWDEDVSKSKKSEKIKSQLVQSEHTNQERDEALNAIIGTYVNRTGNRVIAIEGNDVILVLFPVSDLKKNLQEMGFWNP